MSDVTLILSQIESGDPAAAEKLLPLVYDELRKLAAARMSQENPGQTLQATALVHDAYIRLVDVKQVQHWNSRAHFFGAAAEAMRRILVERARQHASVKHGGLLHRVELDDEYASMKGKEIELLDLNDVLTQFEKEDPQKAKLVKLRYFAGLSLEETADSLGISLATTKRYWAYSRAWLFGKMNRP
jgi:RNA polymerase sigma factor (TIGR02999 family)